MHIQKKFTGFIISSLFLAGSAALADSITWTGATNNVWDTTTTNWTGTGGGTVYADGDDVLFDGTSGEITEIVGLSPNSTTVDSDNKVTFATGIMGVNQAIGGPSILTGTLTKNGSGELELGDPTLRQQFGKVDRNQYSNGFSSVTVNAGTLRIRSRAALGTGTVTLAGGTTFIQASEAARFGFGNEHIDNNFVLSGGIVEFPMTFSNDNSGVWIRNGIVSGPGGIKISGSSRNLALSSNNTYSGGTIIDDNTSIELIIASYSALGTGALTANQAQSSGGGLIAGVDLPGNETYPNGVTNDFVINAGKYLHVSAKSASSRLRIGGVISGGGTLSKTNHGSTLILSGNNTYSGGTVASGGTIICENVNSLGTGPITIGTGATLQMDFVGTLNVATLIIDGSPVADGTYGSSSSPAENQDDVHFSGLGMITVGPPKDPTTTVIAQTGGTNPSDIGISVTLTATVSGGTPTGTVVFYDGLNELGSDTLDGSFEASLTTSALPEGTRNIIAQYQGDATYASSSSSPLAVNIVDDRPASSSLLTLTTGTSPAAPGSSLTYTVTVTGDSPTGMVYFYARDVLIGSVMLDGSFEATISTSDLPLGLQPITAQYEGDLNNKPSSFTFDQEISAPPGTGKLKVFILAGQSNMQGHGRVELGRDLENPAGALIEGGIGSLRAATARDPLKYGYLLDEGNQVNGKPAMMSRDDVYVSYWENSLKREGYLDAAFGVRSGAPDVRIGPEYGFGHVVGAGLGDEVLIIKTAWGGKSLYVDYRPPSSGGTTGAFYLLMLQHVYEVLNNLTTYYPDYDGAGYEIVGFGWHQGWNDRISNPAVAEYEANLVNLINDLRSEFGVPELPFVIANSGLANAPSGPGSLIEAQGNVSDPVLYPQFAGNVMTVDTRPFYYSEFLSPISEGYHWNGNGESYLQIGNSMGEAMLDLLETESAFAIWAGDGAQGLTAGVNDGASDDPDFDGIVNLMEFVLNSHPMVPSPGQLPEAAAPSSGNWFFEYDRNKASVSGVTQVVEYTTNFVDWTQLTIPATSSGSVTITPGTNTDHVRVAIPVSGSAGFARLVLSE